MIKKILLVLLPLFLFANVHAQLAPVFPRLDSLRHAVYLALGESVADTSSVDMYVNMAISKVCTDFGAIKKTGIVAIGKTDDGGTLPADFNHFREYDAVWLMKGDTLRLPLLPAPPNLGAMLPTIGDNLDDKTNLLTPRYYTEWGSPPLLILHPKYIRSAVDSFVVHYYANDNKLEAVADTTVIPKNLLNKVVFYANVLASVDAGRPLDAAINQQLYDGKIVSKNDKEN